MNSHFSSHHCPICTTKTISSNRESNPPRRNCNLSAVSTGFVADLVSCELNSSVSRRNILPYLIGLKRFGKFGWWIFAFCHIFFPFAFYFLVSRSFNVMLHHEPISSYILAWRIDSRRKKLKSKYRSIWMRFQQTITIDLNRAAILINYYWLKLNRAAGIISKTRHYVKKKNTY